MRNEGWRHADDIDLRTVFSESFSALPPEEVVRDVTPWKRAMNRCSSAWCCVPSL